jgi:hypothetical protein
MMNYVYALKIGEAVLHSHTIAERDDTVVG